MMDFHDFATSLWQFGKNLIHSAKFCASLARPSGSGPLRCAHRQIALQQPSMSADQNDKKVEDLDKYDKPKGLYERLLGDKPWPVRSRGESGRG